MLKIKFAIFLFLMFCSSFFAQQYKDYFTDNACRVDFHFCGNARETSVFLDKIKLEPFWGGRHGHLSTNLNLGDFRFRVLDSLSNQQIYIDGFSALFHEWQSTPEALKTSKSFEQTIQFPFPQHAVNLIIEKRLDFDKWQELFRYSLSPTDKLIEKTIPKAVPIKIISKSLTAEKAIDIAVVAEGYSAKEQQKFYKDAYQLARNLLTHEPFNKYKSRINIYAIAASSEQSGISLENKSDWKNTVVNSHFYTFYEPRYTSQPKIRLNFGIWLHLFLTMLFMCWLILQLMVVVEFTIFMHLQLPIIN